jgi:hypothetical protein
LLALLAAGCATPGVARRSDSSPTVITSEPFGDSGPVHDLFAAPYRRPPR